MRFMLLIAAAVSAPTLALAAPSTGEISSSNVLVDQNVHELYKRENLCSLSSPPALCQPNSSVTVEETAKRAYQFYKAFIVDGDPKTMFSLIDNVYLQHRGGFSSGPQAIWSFFCTGRKYGTEASTSWCFDASTNMSYAKYTTTDRWRWVDGCVHEHWDQNESIPAGKCYKLNTTSTS